tara:strand:+ start:299 stop:718 length:420 start_codon:yes stop_codon:yes gene_type:complete
MKNEDLEELGLGHLSDDITYDYILDRILQIMKLKPLGGRNLYEFHPRFNDSDLVLLNPNFYDEGIVLGRGIRNKELISCGDLKVAYKEQEYHNMWNLINSYGWEVLKDWNEFEWMEVRSWVLVQNGEYLREIDNLMKVC